MFKEDKGEEAEEEEEASPGFCLRFLDGLTKRDLPWGLYI